MNKTTTKRKLVTKLTKKKKKSIASDNSKKISDIAEQVKYLMSSVKITDVSMIQCHSQMMDSSIGEVRLSIRYRAHGGRSPDRKSVCTVVNFHLDGRKINKEKAEAVFFIEATFQALYDIPENITTDKNTLQTFADMNGTFNLWPYWREFVSSISVRIGLPALTVPSFRVNNAHLHTSIQNLLNKK